MKKTSINVSIALALGFTALQAHAITVRVDNIGIQELSTYAAEGTLSSTGDLGNVDMIEPFLGQPWESQAVVFFDETGVPSQWAGTTIQGDFDYQFTLQPGQVAWGMLFNWNANLDIPFLNIMDCGLGNVGDTCTGIGTLMQTLPFPNSIAFEYNGVVVTPIPAAGWLMLSGVAGLVALSRRKR